MTPEAREALIESVRQELETGFPLVTTHDRSVKSMATRIVDLWIECQPATSHVERVMFDKLDSLTVKEA